MKGCAACAVVSIGRMMEGQPAPPDKNSLCSQNRSADLLLALEKLLLKPFATSTGEMLVYLTGGGKRRAVG
jgi:hypothetical protein